METWKVVGFRKVDFKDQEGKSVKGYTLFLARNPETPDIVGLECQKVFISSDRIPYCPAENDFIGITYNRYGKIQDIQVLKQGA